MTSFVLDDFVDEFSKGESLLLSSSSSKTALGTAQRLKDQKAHRHANYQVIGLTSASNVDMVKASGCYDHVFSYDDVETLSKDQQYWLLDFAANGTLINNITYSKIDKTYNDDIFTINNFKGSLSTNILEVKKHVYDYIKTDSKIEREFAEYLESGEILVYAKLPRGFNIPTPVGSYNPDWAIVFDTDKFKYVYFIAETKGSMQSLQLKAIEEQKISYAKKHFEALGNTDIKYDVISTYEDLIDKVMK